MFQRERGPITFWRGHRLLGGDAEQTLPVNPEFSEIARVFGGFDLALLPIGYAFKVLLLNSIH